jgi:hypothetical protein
VGLIIHWPSTAFAAPDAEPKIPSPILAVGILLAAAVGFLWLKLRGVEKNLTATHETITKYYAGKQDLLDHEQQLRAVIDAIAFPVRSRQKGLTLLGCNTAYCQTLLGERLELGVGAFDDVRRGLPSTLGFVELRAGASEIWNDAEYGSHAVAHFPIARLAPTAAKAWLKE